jgi:hypothetical protein
MFKNASCDIVDIAQDRDFMCNMAKEWGNYSDPCAKQFVDAIKRSILCFSDGAIMPAI